MKKSSLDQKLIEAIISKAKEFRARLPNALPTEEAIRQATNELVVGATTPKIWSAYKIAAEKKLLSRLKKDKEAKNKEPLESAQEARRRRKHAQGTENAAWERRDQEVLEAEASEEELSELRARHQSVRK